MLNPNVRAYVEQLQQAMRQKFVEMAPSAQIRLEELSLSATSEKVRLEANIQILDRAGMKPPEKVEFSGIGIFGNASIDEIREQLRKSVEDSIDAKVVSN